MLRRSHRQRTKSPWSLVVAASGRISFVVLFQCCLKAGEGIDQLLSLVEGVGPILLAVRGEVEFDGTVTVGDNEVDSSTIPDCSQNGRYGVMTGLVDKLPNVVTLSSCCQL